MPMKWNPDEMRTVARNLNAGATDVRSITDRLKREVDQLVGSGFTGGSGSQKFDGLYQDWDRNAKALLETLDGIAQALSQTGDDIDTVDSNLASRFS